MAGIDVRPYPPPGGKELREDSARNRLKIMKRSRKNNCKSTGSSLRANSPCGSHAIFILGEIYLGLAQDLGASRERIGAGAR